MAATPVLSGRGLTKRFGPVEALLDVDIDVHEGEILAVVGDNGAGKSTLINVLNGVLLPDSGDIAMDGQPVHLRGPQDAIRLGIEAVYQDLALATYLDIAGNVFLGRELTRPGFLGKLGVTDRRRMRKDVETFLRNLEVDIRSRAGQLVGNLSGGQRQAVAVARAAFWSSRVIIMDEPTAALGLRESQAVLKLVETLSSQGLAIVVVSHILPHILQLADRVLVLRHGKRVALLTGGDIDSELLVSLIVGTRERYETVDKTS
jgi:ABC-type sugar transport system ATPase subunit